MSCRLWWRGGYSVRSVLLTLHAADVKRKRRVRLRTFRLCDCSPGRPRLSVFVVVFFLLKSLGTVPYVHLFSYGLHAQVNLDTLDLSRNKIDSFDGLQHLGKLTDLWVREGCFFVLQQQYTYHFFFYVFFSSATAVDHVRVGAYARVCVFFTVVR